MYSQIKGAIGPFLSSKNLQTTGVTFKLLTHVTVLILLAFATLITLSNVFGHPIECSLDDGSIKRVVEIKCWMEGVYVDKSLLGGTIGLDVTRYGVGAARKYDQKNFIHQKYYQWIFPVLSIQALILAMPRIIWHKFEKGLFVKLLAGSDDIVVTEAWKANQKSIIRYMKETPKSTLRMFAIKYWICEALALAALIFDMTLMNWVFNNFWEEYLPAVSAFLDAEPEKFARNAAVLFPTQAKCLYNDFGPSGGQQQRDALCFLPQNTVNEKIFVFLYLWLGLMLLIGIFQLVVSTLLLLFKIIRQYWMRLRMVRSFENQGKLVKLFSDTGNFFMLTRIAMNVNENLFRDFVDELTSSKKTELDSATV